MAGERSSSSPSGTESTDMKDETLVRFGFALSGGREGVLVGLVWVRKAEKEIVGDEAWRERWRVVGRLFWCWSEGEVDDDGGEGDEGNVRW